MIDMALTELEKKDSEVQSILTDRALYPHGLRIRLDSRAVRKLGIKDTPRLGDKMEMKIMVEVIELEAIKNMPSQDDFKIELQITGIEPAMEEKKEMSTEGAFYL